jgi:diadenosine tetraphosphate (Ap4A) HIT family hydrolase
MHVHFHIIPRTMDGGLGVGWPARSLEDEDARELVADIQAALADEG